MTKKEKAKVKRMQEIEKIRKELSKEYIQIKKELAESANR